MARMHDEDYGLPTYWEDTDLIEEERQRQIAKWGIQHHEDGAGSPLDAAKAEMYKHLNDEDTVQGVDPTWANILMEEVYEALAETDPDKLSTELIQVAAVCVAWCEDIRSRKESA